MANSFTVLRRAFALQLLGLGLVTLWLWTLLPRWRGTVPAPGAGEQYVLLLVPTIGIAGTALAIGTVLAGQVWHRDPSRRSALTLGAIVLGAIGACILLAWFGVMVFVILASPATWP
jgi:hypothetical protein